MRCPFCEADKESLKVIDSRSCDGGKSIRRRRECLKCRKRFTTYERVEENARLTVVKRDGRRVPWDREKILLGLERSCFKRPVPELELHRVADEVEDETFRHHDREVPSSFIGQLVADKLRRLDQVAYVRFASVYKQFKTLEQLVQEAQAVLEAKRFEDPTQGRLFVDGRAAAAASEAPANLTEGVEPNFTNGRKPRRAKLPRPTESEPKLRNRNSLRRNPINGEPSIVASPNGISNHAEASRAK